MTVTDDTALPHDAEKPKMALDFIEPKNAFDTQSWREKCENQNKGDGKTTQNCRNRIHCFLL